MTVLPPGGIAISRAVTINRAGRIVLPVDAAPLNIGPGCILGLDEVAQRIELSPEAEPEAEPGPSAARHQTLRRSTPAFGAAAATRAERGSRAKRCGSERIASSAPRSS